MKGTFSRATTEAKSGIIRDLSPDALSVFCTSSTLQYMYFAHLENLRHKVTSLESKTRDFHSPQIRVRTWKIQCQYEDFNTKGLCQNIN